MITGTIKSAVKLQLLENKWQQKKNNLNENKKSLSEMTQEERMIADFQERAEQERERNSHADTYNKLKTGGKLTSEEIDYLKKHDPEALRKYREDQAEKAAYERELKNCKTKEDALRVKMNKLGNFAAQAKKITTNPYIPLDKKVELMNQLNNKLCMINDAHQEFQESQAYRNMPAEGELQEERTDEMQDKQGGRVMSMNIGLTFNSTVQGTDYKKTNTTRTQKYSGTEKAETFSFAAGANDISKANEEKLSSKAQEFLKDLRKQYGDYDFFIGNSTDDLKSLSKSGSKEFSVIFSSAEIERMAGDEKYAKEKMQGVENAVNMSKKICEQEGFTSAFGALNTGNGTVNKIGIIVDDNGNMKLFAELEKTSEKQKERLEKTKEKRVEEKKAHEKTEKRNPYEKEDKDSVKRTTVEADSMEELIEKIKNVDWNNISGSKSGDRFTFSV